MPSVFRRIKPVHFSKDAIQLCTVSNGARIPGFGNIVTPEELKEVIALLDNAVALLNEAMTASRKRQDEIRTEFDGIMREIDKIRLSHQN
jgi:hypothetical protein